MPETGTDFATYLPLISAAFVFAFGIFTWTKAPKREVTTLFLAFCIAITYWLFGTFMMYLNFTDTVRATAWDRFVYIGVVFVPTLMHHFSIAITGMDKQRKLLWLTYGYSLFFLFLSRTTWFVDGINVFERVIHSQARIGHHVFLVLFYPIAFMMFWNLWRYRKRTDDERMKSVVDLTTVAFLNILLVGGTAYLPAYGIDIGYPFSYFSGVVFVILMAYVVAKFEFISTRVVSAEMFMFFIVAFFGVNVVLQRSFDQMIMQVVALLVVVYFGGRLIASTKLGEEQRERLQHLADDLAVANEELRELDRLKSEFVSIASHQLRTPVSVMKGYLSLIGEGAYGKVSPEVREKVGQMYRMNDRLVHLINNMLNVSRIEKERIDFTCSGFDLEPVIADIIEEMSYKAKEKGLSLAFPDGDPALPLRVHVDREKVSEILTNLIDNAIKYTEQGGITITAQANIKKEEVEVRVRDTGLGIPDDAIRHLFTKFYRAKRDVNLRTQGTGLGLYICKSFVEGMGGAIKVETTSKEGTTFLFTLPMIPKGACLGELPEGTGGKTAE